MVKRIFHKYTSASITEAAAAIYAAAVLALMAYRLFLGVEMTDEAYYISSSYRYLHGNIPFYDSWDPQIGSALLALPVFWIKSLFGGTQGIMLYSRLSFLVFKLLMSAPLYLAIKKRFSRGVCMLICVAYAIYTPFSLYNWSYNNLCLTFLISGCFLFLYSTDLDDGQKSNIPLATAGVFHALMAFSYISSTPLCLLFGLMLVMLSRLGSGSWKRAWKRLIPYALGGLGTAALLLAILYAITGGRLFLDMPNIFTHYYYSGDMGNPIQSFFSTIYVCLNVLARNWAAVLFLVLFSLALRLFKGRGWAALLSPLVFLIMTGPPEINSYILIEYACYTGLAFFIFAINADWKDKFVRGLYLVGAGGSLLYFLCVGLTSAGAIAQARFAFYAGALCLVVLVTYEMAKIFPGAVLLRLLPALACCAGVLICWYSYSYRDQPPLSVDTTVTSGVYAGCKTGAPRAEAYMRLEQVLKQRQIPGGKVMIVGNYPGVYLMTPMTPCAPSTWSTYYALEGYQAALYMNKGEHFMPDQIVFLNDIEYNAFIANPESELGSIIKAGYAMAYTESLSYDELEKGVYSIRIFDRTGYNTDV